MRTVRRHVPRAHAAAPAPPAAPQYTMAPPGMNGFGGCIAAVYAGAAVLMELDCLAMQAAFRKCVARQPRPRFLPAPPPGARLHFVPSVWPLPGRRDPQRSGSTDLPSCNCHPPPTGPSRQYRFPTRTWT